MHNSIRLFALWLVALNPFASRAATEYYISPAGKNDHPGTARTEAWATFAHAFSRLQPGDTLTVLPGEYRESFESHTVSGAKGRPITIRAEQAGTAHLRGDIALETFQRVPATLYTWKADLDTPVEGVAEGSTLRQYAYVGSPGEVEFVRGSFHFDDQARRLYLRTSDGAPPAHHALSISITNGHGFSFDRATDLIIEGLRFSGYNARFQADPRTQRNRWGLHFRDAERIVVRNCQFYFNGGGVGFRQVKDALVENCVSIANDSPHFASNACIFTWGPAERVTYRNNLVHSTTSRGLRFYVGGSIDCVMEGNVVFGTAREALQFKGGIHATGIVRNNVVLGSSSPAGVRPENMTGNIFSARPSRAEDINQSGTNIIFPDHPGFRPDRNFVDPLRHDYRLQSDSPLRRSGPGGSDPGPHPYRDEVFFVSPQGDDAAAGTSVATAWKTLARAASRLQPGQTLYLLAGIYEESLKPAASGQPGQPIRIRSRGRDRVVLDGRGNRAVGLDLDGRAHLQIEGLIIRDFQQAGIRLADSRHIAIHNSRLFGSDTSITVERSRDITLQHNLFSTPRKAALQLADSGRAWIHFNAFNPGPAAALALDQATAREIEVDRNDYSSAEAVKWKLGDRAWDSLAAWQKASSLDLRSRVVPLAWRQEGAEVAAVLAAGSPQIGRGFPGQSIGPWKSGSRPAPIAIENVAPFAITATTANLECWTPTAESNPTIEWGLSPAATEKQSARFSNSSFHTHSVIGLKPGTEYVYRFLAEGNESEPWYWADDAGNFLPAGSRRKVATPWQRFRTLVRDREPTTFFVANDGADQSSGTSRSRAWKTLFHATGQLRPGDTLIVAAGTYPEFVPLRVTGDAGRPIAIRGEEGAVVRLDGSGRVRPTSFRVASKFHVYLDHFHLRHFAADEYLTTRSAGAVEILDGGSIRVSRFLYDGRGPGYAALFLHGFGTRHLTVDNCVALHGWNGAAFGNVPHLVLRNSVFYNNQITHFGINNRPDEPFTMTRNLIADLIPIKTANPLISITAPDEFVLDYNCWFARVPRDRRLLIRGSFPVAGARVSGGFTFDELRGKVKTDQHSLFGNPGMPIAARLVSPDNAKGWSEIELKSGQEVFFRDFIVDPAGIAARAADGQPIGLEPGLFAGGNREKRGTR